MAVKINMSKRNTEEWHADRFKVLNFFTILSLIQIPLFVFVYGNTVSHAASMAILLAAAPIALTYPIGRISRSPILAGNWIVGVGFMLFLRLASLSDGITAPALTWSVSIPIIVTLICGSISGVVWFFLVVLKISLLYWAQKTGHLIVQEHSEIEHLLVHYVTLLGITVLSLCLAMVTEYYRNRYLTKIEQTNKQLQDALDNIKTLSGMLPMCAWCKKIRDDKGYWDGVEKYVEKHSNIAFSHGICPECHAKQRELIK